MTINRTKLGVTDPKLTREILFVYSKKFHPVYIYTYIQFTISIEHYGTESTLIQMNERFKYAMMSLNV